MASRRKARILAFQSLYAWDASGMGTDELLSFSWLGDDSAAREDEELKSFAGLVVSGTLENLEAIDAAIANLYDVILMDIEMPNVDGFEAVGAIRRREHETGRRVPIIALTAHAMAGDRQRCLDAGMDDYLTKPLQPHELAEAIERVTASAQEPPRT